MKRLILIVFCTVLLSCSDDAPSVLKSKNVDSTINASGELISSDNAIISPPQAKGMWQHKITFMEKN